MVTTTVARTLSVLRWTGGGILAVVGLAGIPEDLATWARWIAAIRPYISHDIVRTILVATGVLLIAFPNALQLSRRLLGVHHDDQQAESGRPGTTAAGGPQSYSDGDWITAAIVAPERAVTAMKRVGAGLSMNGNRAAVVSQLQSAIDQEVSQLRTRFAAGGTTDEARCEACIAKVAADLIERESASLFYELRQKPGVDPKGAFARMIRSLDEAG